MSLQKDPQKLSSKNLRKLSKLPPKRHRKLQIRQAMLRNRNKVNKKRSLSSRKEIKRRKINPRKNPKVSLQRKSSSKSSQKNKSNSNRRDRSSSSKRKRRFLKLLRWISELER